MASCVAVLHRVLGGDIGIISYAMGYTQPSYNSISVELVLLKHSKHATYCYIRCQVLFGIYPLALRKHSTRGTL